MKSLSTTTLVILGATSDYVRQRLIPVIRELWIRGRISQYQKIILVDEEDLSIDEYLHTVADDLLSDLTLLHMQYLPLNIDTDGLYPIWTKLAEMENFQVVIYMPENNQELINYINEFSKPQYIQFADKFGLRILVDTPFGRNLAQARSMNRQLNEMFGAPNVLRNDRYMLHPQVNELAEIRRNDSKFNYLLNGRHVGRVRVVLTEQADTDYPYPTESILITHLQSHLLQQLTIIGADFESDNLPFAKADFLDSLEISTENAKLASLSGDTPHYIRIELTSRLPAWQDTTFEIICGIGLDRAENYIELDLREPHPQYGSQMQIELSDTTDSKKMLLEDYFYTLLHSLRGDDVFFANQQETEAQWRLVEQLQEKLRNIRIQAFLPGESWDNIG